MNRRLMEDGILEYYRCLLEEKAIDAITALLYFLYRYYLKLMQ